MTSTHIRSVLGSVAEGGATSTPGSFSDIMQSPVSSSKPLQGQLNGEFVRCYMCAFIRYQSDLDKYKHICKVF